MFHIIPYGVDKTTELIDMDIVEQLAKENKPKLIIAWFSAYSRSLDWKRFRRIADDVGAILMADIAHIAGLIAGWVLENPVPYCDIVTTTTHKTLRWPRGAMIMAKEKYGPDIARSVFPGIQWGPHDHTIFAKAIAFGEALSPEFSTYTRQVIANARQMAKVFGEEWIRVISGGTDNHIVLIDAYGSLGLTGKEAEKILEHIGVSTNKNMIPYDTRKPLDPSGIRIGTPAITTRGFDEAATEKLAHIMVRALKEHTNEALQIELKSQVRELCITYPIPGIH